MCTDEYLLSPAHYVYFTTRYWMICTGKTHQYSTHTTSGTMLLSRFETNPRIKMRQESTNTRKKLDVNYVGCPPPFPPIDSYAQSGSVKPSTQVSRIHTSRPQTNDPRPVRIRQFRLQVEHVTNHTPSQATPLPDCHVNLSSIH